VRALGGVPFLGNIKIAIAAPILFHIRRPVNTRTDNVLVQIPVPGGQTTRATHISITFFIDEKILEQVQDPITGLVEKIAFGLLDLL
jgi:hypothetical protein